ncbi:rcc01693 family protein [Ancylobacter aquaticus]|uniref:rcc01693 family protein n=1 Tax=Ancylobacter aquaticus TaxID=100 RepID=UPI0024783C7A|nr:rcc01693 family protein [Ancylobacter aquaticus]
MGGARAFPWEDAMAVGFDRLRLSSGAFWALTPRELAAALRAFSGPARSPLDQAALAALMAQFPD